MTQPARVTDHQLPLEPELIGITHHINPKDLVTLMPGIDAICEAGRGHGCWYPFCCCFTERKDHLEQEDDAA